MASNNAATITPSPPKPKQKTLLDTFDPRHKRIEPLQNLRPHAQTGRLIDSHPGKRTKPMRVLCLGMSRTGTMSLFTAMQRLGYTPYHMAVAIGAPKSNLDLWCEGLRAKYHGEGKKWGREEFDKMLGDYDGIADVPGICFVEELVEAYPEAKIVLQTRDVEPWLKSMDATGGRVMRWKGWDGIAPWDPSLAGPFWRHAKVVCPIAFRTMSDFSSAESPARQAFRDHYELVRRVVPRERLLEYKVQDGWEPLCHFLEVEVPDEEFPRVNDAEQFLFVHGMMWWLGFGKMVAKIGAMVAVPAAGVAAAWWWQGR